jgi:hypothetical protein
MQGAPNVNYRCESALIMGPVGGVQLAPTNQVSCTYRHGGYLYSNRPTFIAPGSGRITAVLDVRDKRLRMRIHSSDGVALTAVGPGTVPLQVRDDVGAFNPGIPMAVGYWPFTQLGEPRSADG